MAQELRLHFPGRNLGRDPAAMRKIGAILRVHLEPHLVRFGAVAAFERIEKLLLWCGTVMEQPATAGHE